MKQGVGKPSRAAAPRASDGARGASLSRPGKTTKQKLLDEVRVLFLRDLPAVTAALLQGAKEGSVPHLKLLIELGVLDKEMLGDRAAARDAKSVGDLLLEQFRLDKQERGEAERRQKSSAG